MGLLEDARNIQRKDPAARSVLEVILLYPGFHILVYHRICLLYTSLDDRVVKAVGFQGELAVAAALNAQLGDNVQRSGAQHLRCV